MLGRGPNVRHDAGTLVSKTTISSMTVVRICEADARMGNLNCHLRGTKFAGCGFMQGDFARLGTMIDGQRQRDCLRHVESVAWSCFLFFLFSLFKKMADELWL